MEGLKIVGLCVLAAVLYGLAQDQITARLCLEYFTVAHPPLVDSTSPTVVALAFGVAATWWVGVILGTGLAISARAGQAPKLAWRQLVRPVALLLAAMAVISIAAGIAGWAVASSSGALPPNGLDQLIPAERHARLFADWRAHQAAYFVGAIGGLALCGWTVWTRRRMALAQRSERTAPA